MRKATRRRHRPTRVRNRRRGFPRPAGSSLVQKNTGRRHWADRPVRVFPHPESTTHFSSPRACGRCIRAFRDEILSQSRSKRLHPSVRGRGRSNVDGESQVAHRPNQATTVVDSVGQSRQPIRVARPVWALNSTIRPAGNPNRAYAARRSSADYLTRLAWKRVRSYAPRHGRKTY